MRIAVAYRREDGGYGGRLLTDLARSLPRDEVLSARRGAGFDVLVAVVGAQWQVGSREDRVRRALETAFRGSGRVVVVQLPEAVMPEPDDLPPGLAELADVDPVGASDEYWHATVEHVVARVRSLARPGGRRFWDRVRTRPKLSIGAAVATLAAIVGMLSTLGVFAETPTERGTVVVDENGVANGITLAEWASDAGDVGKESPSQPDTPGSDGYGFEVQLTLDHPEDDRYALRWTARDFTQGRPIAGFRDIVWRWYAADQVTGPHHVWVPCPPLDAVQFVVWFELTNESTPERPLLGRDSSPVGDCRHGE